MLCERCKKREANVIVTEIIDGVQTQHGYCIRCASEMGLGSFGEVEIPLGKLLSGILGLASEEDDNAESDELKKLTCPSCKMTYGEFLKESHFGCADCYVTFGPLIAKNIKKLQVNDTHIGKRPNNHKVDTKREETKIDVEEDKITKEEQIALLQSRLKEALQEEDYEAAASFRDQIRALQKE